MRRYYFNIEGNGIEIRDTQGLVLPQLSDLGEVLSALIADVTIDENWLDDLNVRYTMRVDDDAGVTVAVVPLDRLPDNDDYFFEVMRPDTQLDPVLRAHAGQSDETQDVSWVRRVLT